MKRLSIKERRLWEHVGAHDPAMDSPLMEGGWRRYSYGGGSAQRTFVAFSDSIYFRCEGWDWMFKSRKENVNLCGEGHD